MRLKEEGDSKRVLAVCTANMLRSPTAAVVLSQEPYNFNTRSCGIDEDALIPVTLRLLGWAEEIVCMDKTHFNHLWNMLDGDDKYKLSCLGIPDVYNYMETELVNLIKERYNRIHEDNP